MLDTPSDERLDDITRLVQKLFNAPIALVSLVDADRQWFKSRQGLEASETPRDVSFCGHAILSDELFVVPDACRDQRFADNPLVTGEPRVRFYAGYPLKAATGHRLGTLCVIDHEPRELSAAQRELLADVGKLAEHQLRSIALATTDELTSISNRRGFMLLARQALAACGRAGQPAAMLVLDLDGFKRINDTLGHDEGDRALKDFARCLLLTFRSSDVIGRLGGDEFCVLMSGADAGAVKVALQRLQARVEEANARRPAGAQLAFSAGSQVLDVVETDDLDALLAAADAEMYRAKRDRRESGVAI